MLERVTVFHVTRLGTGGVLEKKKERGFTFTFKNDLPMMGGKAGWIAGFSAVEVGVLITALGESWRQWVAACTKWQSFRAPAWEQSSALALETRVAIEFGPSNLELECAGEIIREQCRSMQDTAVIVYQ